LSQHHERGTHFDNLIRFRVQSRAHGAESRKKIVISYQLSVISTIQGVGQGAWRMGQRAKKVQGSRFKAQSWKRMKDRLQEQGAERMGHRNSKE
jgi:hypothetical protein